VVGSTKARRGGTDAGRNAGQTKGKRERARRRREEGEELALQPRWWATSSAVVAAVLRLRLSMMPC